MRTRRHPAALAAVLLLHLAVGWVLLHGFASRARPLDKSVVSVQIVSVNSPPLPPPPLPAGTKPSAAVPLPSRLPDPMHLPKSMQVTVPELPQDGPAAPVSAAVAWAHPAEQAASADAAPTTAAPPPPKPVAASALRYRTEPAIAVPPLSRRMNESGQVLLRVVFDVTGAPVQVDLAKSSGFARLDEQAVQAMRAARIQPVLENGRAIAVSATAVLSYELD